MQCSACKSERKINPDKTQLGVQKKLPRIYHSGISNLLSCALILMMAPQMSSDNHRPVRTWQEIAAEASRERDPKKLMELTEELERALEERDAKLRFDRKSASASE